MLELDIPFIPLDAFDLTFPNLTTVFLISVLPTGCDPDELSSREVMAISFLSRHPSVLHLDWKPKSPAFDIDTGFLPNLRTLSSYAIATSMLRAGIEMSALTSIVNLSLDHQDTFALLSTHRHRLGSLRYLSLLPSASFMVTGLGDILPNLQAVGVKAAQWLGFEVSVELHVAKPR